MNKTVLTLAIFAFCLFPQVLSDDRELGSIGTINLGNIGTLLGSLIGGTKNTTNTTSPTNTTAPVSNTTTPVQNNTSTNTTVPANNTSPADTPAPVNNNTSTNTTAPVNTTVPTAPVNTTIPPNTTAPVDNSTSPVNNSTSSTPVDNTTQPTNSTTPVDSGNTTTPVDTTPVTPVDTNWYARNDVDRAAFKQKCLDIHNILRGAVGVAPLAWSDSLAASAQDWANNMAVYGFRHSGRTGENIASTTYSTKVTVRLLGLWTNEQDWFIKGCVYPKCSSNGNEVGHYTQMVWAKTTQVGCGFAPGVNKQWNYLCCQYYRAGNVIGQTVFPYTAPAV